MATAQAERLFLNSMFVGRKWDVAYITPPSRKSVSAIIPTMLLTVSTMPQSENEPLLAGATATTVVVGRTVVDCEVVVDCCTAGVTVIPNDEELSEACGTPESVTVMQ